MKLRKIKWDSHPVLGNLELDFTNPQTGEAYGTVLFAGENGTGKSTILESLSAFLNIGSYANFDYIEYSVGHDIFRTAKPVDVNTYHTFFDVIDSNGFRNEIRSDRNNRVDLIQSDLTDLRHYGCVYSKARSDYKTKKVTYATTTELDKDKYDIDTAEDFTPLKQLIVDVVNQDNSDYSESNKMRGSEPQSWSEFYLTSKLFRFKSAFDGFFEKLKYERVADRDGEKTILFSKNQVLIGVDNLSTGEKQIVFRGIFLLRNTNVLDGATIMIDEPELSMHPKWERKIFSYYKELFSQGGNQKTQIIFATHSDHVLREALKDRDNSLVVILEDAGGEIIGRNIDAPSVLPSITTAETTYLAFDVASNDYHIELYGWLQDKENVASVKACDSLILNHPLYNSSRHYKPSRHGNTTYETLCTYVRNAIHHPASGNTFSEQELRSSIELLIEICK